MVVTNGVAYAYPDRKEIVFNDLKIERGDQWLLLGESGCGKTTLLHLLGGLLRSQKGTIEIDGSVISKMAEHELDRFRGKHIGFIFQKNHLVSALSVIDNLKLAPFLAGIKIDGSRISEVMRQLDLMDTSLARVSTLSNGQAQRVAIARAAMNRPTCILADEPTSALDDKNCERVINLLVSASAVNRATLIVATHDQRLKSRFSNQVLLAI
jgi:ABC-type lipoprotein export system ATPase subunit